MTSSQDFGTYSPAGNEAPGAHLAPPAPPSSYTVPPAPPSSYDLDSPHGEQPSTAEVAKDHASAVAGNAADAAQHVAGVAKDQVGQVTAEAGKQVRQLLGQAQSELSDQAAAQQQKLAGGLHAVGDQLKTMAQNSDQSGVATDLAHQAADKAHQFAGWLDDRDPGSVLTEVRTFARQRPGVFLAVALGAGLVAGRLARGLAADPDDTDNGAAPAVNTPASVAGSDTRRAIASPPPTVLPGDTHAIETDLYGTGAVPDWAGKSAAQLGDSR